MASLEQELEREDLATFQARLDTMKGHWDRNTCNLAEGRGRKVTSLPPVTLFVGLLPQGLTQEGLANIFRPFGDLLRVDLVRGREFGFVTFCRRHAAAAAIDSLHKKSPWRMTVKYKLGDREKAERQEREAMALQFSQRWDRERKEPEPEKDYDEEIADERRMETEVDKFFQDDSSDEEWSMIPVMTSEKEVNDIVPAKEAYEGEEALLPPCSRCGRPGSVRCSGCRTVRYCGAACQRLEWAKHKGSCSQQGRPVRREVIRNLAVNTEPGLNSEIGMVHEDQVKCDMEQPSCASRISGDHSSGNISVQEAYLDKDKLSKIKEKGKPSDNSEAQGQVVFGKTPVVEREVINSFDQQPSLKDVGAKDTKPEKQGSSDKTLENVSNIESKPVSNSDTHSDSNTEEDFVTFAECVTPVEVEYLAEPFVGENSEQVCGLTSGVKVKLDNKESAETIGDCEAVPRDQAIYMIPEILPFDMEDPDCLVELVSLESGTGVAVVRRTDPEGESILASLLSKCTSPVSLSLAHGQLVAALSPSGSYIRVRVTSVLPDTQQAECLTLDGGFEKLIRHFSSLTHLPEDCLLVPLLSRRVKVLAPAQLSLRGVYSLRLVAPGELPTVLLTPAEARQACPPGPLSIPQEPKSQESAPTGEQVTKAKSYSSSYSGVSCVGLTVGRVQEVAVLHVESPRAVFVCPDIQNSWQELINLQNQVFATASSLTLNPMYRPEPGTLVFAKCSKDGLWYRAVVETLDGDFLDCFFPDFGFHEVVELTSIREINRRLAFARRKFLACRCVLEDWEEGEEDWSPRELRNLNKLLPVSEEKVKVVVFKKIDDSYIIKVTGDKRVDRSTVSGHREDPEEELARLRQENTELKQQLARMELAAKE